jgi:hypothetical protein
VPDRPQTQARKVAAELLFQDIDPHQVAPAAVAWMGVGVEMPEPVVSRRKVGPAAAAVVAAASDAAAGTCPIARGQGRAQIHSPLVPYGQHILHARCAHCKNHGGAAKRSVPDLFHDSVPIHALAEGAPRAVTPRHVPSRPHARNHIQSP